MALFANFLRYWQSYQSRIAVFFILCMIAGLFWSRAVLSIAIVCFFVNALNPLSFKSKLQYWIKDKFSIFCFLFFVVYFISGFWSQNQDGFWYAISNKLPFLVLPFAFLSLPLNNKKLMRVLFGGLFLMQVVVVVYSLTMFLSNLEYYLEGYNFSHTLPTTKYDDHIRFSLSLVLSINLILFLLFEKKEYALSRLFQSFLIISGIMFFVFVHILAVKTGIIALYILIVFFVILRLFKINKRAAWTALIGICILPMLAYQFVPTFKTKVGYVFYEIGEYRNHGKMDYNLSDQGRILSYKVAGTVFKENILLGTGLGDLKDEMNNGYEASYPEVPPINRLIPHNQFLFTFVALGLFLGFVLLLMMYGGVVKLGSTSIYSKITLLVFIFAFMAEAMLEIQFGVFIYLLFTLLWRQMNSSTNKLQNTQIN